MPVGDCFGKRGCSSRGSAFLMVNLHRLTRLPLPSLANTPQFGATIGEASSELALSQQGGASAVGPGEESLFGPFDRNDAYRQGWEMVVEEHKPGLHYFVWRRYLRKGLFIYKSKTLYETATVAQITGFTYDLDFRRVWDESMACQLPIAPPSEAAAAAAGQASGPPVMTPAMAEAKAAGGRCVLGLAVL